jgi:hypothetical protein
MYKQKIRSFYLIFSLSVYIIACTKSAPAPSGLNNSNGNGRSSGNTTSTLTYINDTYTRIIVIFNNQIQTIQVGSNIVFSGTPGSKLSGTASTSGQTSTGTQVGLQLAWNINNTFPASGNASTDLDATSDFFFLISSINHRLNVPNYMSIMDCRHKLLIMYQYPMTEKPIILVITKRIATQT